MVLPCTAVGTPLALYALALVVRLVLLAGFADPAYPDSFYYVDVARSLATGQGFTINAIWIFPEVGGTIPAYPTLPVPSNAHWMPLASIVQVPFIWLLGPTALASALPFALLGSLAAPLTWALARDAGATRLVAVGAGVLIAIPAASAVFMAQPDNFGLYQPLVAAALWMGARGLRGNARAFALGGLLVGLATLARNDGVLVGAALAIAFAWDRWAAWRSRGIRRPAIPAWAAVACFALFLAVVAPWLARQLAVFGSISPSSASGKVLFIRSIEEWNSITTPANLEWLLGQGVGALVGSRVGGLVAAITILSILVGGVVLAPLVVVGAWARRRSLDFGPFFAYAALLFTFSALVSAVHVPGGTFIHSAVGLAPHAYVLALEGIAVAVAWVAARRSTWHAATATRVFTVAAIGIAVMVAVGSAVVTQAAWAARRDDFLLVDRGLAEAGALPDDRVMSIDASGTLYWTGHGGVVLVNDPLETIEEVARAYDIRWLVLNRADTVASVAPILDGVPARVAGRTRGEPAGPPAAGRPAAPAGRPGRRALPGLPGRRRHALRGGGAMTAQPTAWAMGRREAWLSAGLVFVVALLVRAWAAGQVPFGIPEDTAYYWGVARNLAEGRGIVTDAIWSYATPARDPVTGAFGFFFPRPAFEIWQPLPTPAGAPPDAGVAAPRPTASTLPVAALLGALVPVVAWRIAADVAEERALTVERARTLGLGAGLVAAVSLPLVLPSAHLDSVNAFALPALLACLLMVRLARRPPERALDPRLVGLGLLIGIAGLARNEAAWVGLAWAIVAAGALRSRGWPAVARAVVVPGVIAVAVMAPWLARNWIVFGSPLPGQAITNAWAITGTEIFAWLDPATAAEYLALGPAAWLDHRVGGFAHNLLYVLLIPGAPLAIVGLLALPWAARFRALRPLLILALITFLVTTLVFPIQTRWGTFLHASIPAAVLLLVAGLAGLDEGLAWVGRRRGWTRPVAWLGPLFAGLGAVLFMVPGVIAYGSQASGTEAAYVDLGRRMAAAGVPLDGSSPVIANHPIWVAEVHRVEALGLPDEPVASVVDLAGAFGAQVLILDGGHGGWPDRLASDPDAGCLVPVALPPPAEGAADGGDDDFRVFRVACP